MDKVKQPVLRILLLEPAGLDAARVRHALLDGSMDCEMLHIAAAEELPAAFDTFHPDVVICACDSPQLDGRVVLEALHRDHPTVPVIVITHELTDLEAVAFIESEAKGYALKSDLRRIASEVRHAVSREEAIRARKATERELREALEQLKLFRTMIDHSPDGIEIIDPETRRFVDVNEAVCTSLGYTREEMLGMHVLDIDASDDQMELELLDGQLRERGQIRFERVHRRKDGSEVPVEVNLKMLELDRPYALSITRDITKRKETEAELLRLNRGLRTLSEVNRTVVRATSEAQLMRDICGIMSGHGGYRLAWIGLARDDEEKSIAVMALSGAGEGYLKGLDLSWADVPSGRGPAGIAIRSGDTQIVQNIGNDPRFDAWRVAAQEYGFGSSITLPVMASGRAFGVLNLYSATTDAFGESELELLEEVASDLAFGITNLRTRLERDEAVQQREQQVVRLRDNMEDAVEAIATVVEMRDPYTAGHQRRVAELAAAIAREMGLGEDQVHGVHLAGIVHDIGKIHIPAEILSKPGALSHLEYAFVKLHSQAGYDILKGIDFPWPIAQTVLQHHERLDGSGYPQALSGDNIVQDARILCVADVVESMSSHRPYRPGRGLDAALDEIRRNRGVLYDPQAVDACLELFLNKRYQLPEH
jgi:PAS domain S-box-containing protein